MSWDKPRIISIVVDNESWILPHAQELVAACNKNGDKAVLCRMHEEVQRGSVAFYLGCTKITPPEILVRNAHNLVVHESDLPKGRGFAPMTWQILEGASEIKVCLIEAADEADAGNIIYKDSIKLKGDELLPEWRALQGKKTVELCLRFLNEKNPPAGTKQQGTPSIYKRRTPEDSRLDPEKPLAEQINLLRVVDNERYPAFFEYCGKRYKLVISKDS
jgi:methionyl-tRNA formyltransferase